MFKNNMSTEMIVINSKLSEALDTALIGNTVSQFAKKCNLVDTKPLMDILDKKLIYKPSRELLRKIASNSYRGTIPYTFLYEICGYSEFDAEEDKKWMDFQPKRGDLLYIDLGFGYDSEQSGIRPCVVLQNDVGNAHSSTIVILPVTSKLRRFGKTHVKLTKEDGIRTESYILAEQIRVVSKRRAFYNGCVNKITELSDEVMKKIETAVDFELGKKELLFKENKAYTLASQVKVLRHNIKVKQSRDLIDIYHEKLNEFKAYCADYNKDYMEVYNNFKTLDLQYA